MDPSLSLVLALLLGFTKATQVPYCYGTCPEYEVIAKHPDLGYEVRKYKPCQWMCTSLDSLTFGPAMAARGRLKNFRSEESKLLGVEISDDTWPGVVSNDGKHYRVCYFVPPDITLPQVVGDVTVERLPEIFYVRPFEGTPSAELGEKNMEILKKILMDNHERFDNLMYFAAGYESYFAFKHHNEIWIALVE